eukprot:scaffold207_cov409-Prasinococcus_capsulatus_cf.AAC.118
MYSQTSYNAYLRKPFAGKQWIHRRIATQELIRKGGATVSLPSASPICCGSKTKRATSFPCSYGSRPGATLGPVGMLSEACSCTSFVHDGDFPYLGWRARMTLSPGLVVRGPWKT